MFTECAVFCRRSPICSAMFMNRLLNTSSITGSASVPTACRDSRGTTRASSIGPARITRACQPGSTTVVALRSATIAGPSMSAPARKDSRTNRPASSQASLCMRTLASGAGR